MITELHHQTHQQTMNINNFPLLPPHTTHTSPMMYHTPLSSTAEEVISLEIRPPTFGEGDMSAKEDAR